MQETSNDWFINYYPYVSLVLQNSENKNFKKWVTLAVKQVNKDLDLKDLSKEPIKIRSKIRMLNIYNDSHNVQESIKGDFITGLLQYKKRRFPLDALINDYPQVDIFDAKARLLVRYVVRAINENDGRNFAQVLQGDGKRKWRASGDTTNRIMEFVGGKRKKNPFGRKKVDPKVSSSFQGKKVW